MTIKPLTAGRGLIMGLADAVPGVSGGTIALLLGIHPRLVGAIANLHPRMALSFFALLNPNKRLRAWRTIEANDAPFLAVLGMGIAAGLYIGATIIVTLIETQPRLLAALFLALVVTSLPGPLAHASGTVRSWGIGCLAALFAFTLALLPLGDATPALWILPLLGAVAACAMILPGISGSYILLLLGAYPLLLAAVHELDLLVLALLGGGAAIGLLSFSHFLRKLLDRHSGPTHAAMVGLLVGSMGLLWPWRTAAGFAEGLPTWPTTDGLGWILLAGTIGALLGWFVTALSEKE